MVITVNKVTMKFVLVNNGFSKNKGGVVPRIKKIRVFCPLPSSNSTLFILLFN